MNSRIAGLVAAGLLAGSLLAFLLMFQPTLPTGQVITGKPVVGGPFTLTDQTGKRVTEKDFLGKYMLVFFGFTNCPDICPSGLQVMSAALDKVGSKAADVVPVFITLDAQRDTPDKLAQYLKSFHPRLVGLTGSAEEVAAAAKVYRVYYEKVTDEKSPDSYSYDHSAIFYLMGKDGVFLSPLPHTTSVDELATSLSAALP
ncbi:MAG TPA: SCO family protein [Hyphomicrobium sp.]|nr:SCO family protein [Hyphomicrobium sp.]